MFSREYNFNGVNCRLQFICKNYNKAWPHFEWSILINNEIFSYSTGTGHATSKRDQYVADVICGKNTKPKNKETFSFENGNESLWVHIPEISEIFDCLFFDAQCGESTFQDFVDNCGGNIDSIKDFKTYMLCQDTIVRLRKALGKDYYNIRQIIEKARENA